MTMDGQEKNEKYVYSYIYIYSWTSKSHCKRQVINLLKFLFSHKKHSFPTKWTKLSLHNLSHTRYFQRELTHTSCKPSVA